MNTPLITGNGHSYHHEQERSYRKQIARQLRRRYVERIYINLSITP